jgi:hypothetical protein
MRVRGVSLAIAVALAGCNDPTNDLDDGSHAPAPLPTSTVSTTALTYPEGPKDVAKGAIVPNYTFPGFPNAKVSNQALTPIAFGDFWNPHADDPEYAPESPAEDDRLYPPESPYGGGKNKPRALAIVIGSVWCGPCNEEAKSLLPGLRLKYGPCGGEIFYQLIEGMPGSVAEEKDLRNWSKVYKVDYPASIDPSKQLSKLYPTGNYPDSAIVDLRTMKVTETIQGVADDAFWLSFESLLDQECLASQ